MKAALFQEVGKLEIADAPMPKCPEGGLLIDVGGCAVCGTDVKIYHHGHRLIVPPRVTGHEVAGTIIEVGASVKGFAEGERVAVAAALPCGSCYYCSRGWQTMCDNLTAMGYHYDGGFAEFMAVPEVAVRTGCVNKVPEGMSLEEAALAEPLACVINGHELCKVSMGQTVAVIGAGPIGCFQVQLAKAEGAKKVMLFDISAERLAMSAHMGADVSVDSSKEDAVERVMDETDGRGAEVVIVACSSGKAQELGLRMVAKRGVVNFFGGLPKDQPFIQFDSNLAHYREFYVIGNTGSTPRHNAMAVDLIASGRIDAKSLISHRLPIEKTLDGILTTEAGKALKVMIKKDAQ